VSSERFGVVEDNGVWLRGWPVRPRPRVNMQLAAATAMPLQALRGDRALRLFTARDGRLYLYSADGELAAGWPLAGPAAAAGTPLLLDIDEDGAIELVAAGAFPRITGIDDDGESLQTEARSGLAVWKLDNASAGRSRMWGGSAWRDGWATVAPTGGGGDSSALLVGGRHTCYPSPLTGATLRVRGTAGADCQVRATVYNLEGEDVAVSDARDVRPGTFELEVDLSSAVSGMYVCRLEAVQGGQSADSIQAVAVVR
jgi:hypothetical protein